MVARAPLSVRPLVCVCVCGVHQACAQLPVACVVVGAHVLLQLGEASGPKGPQFSSQAGQRTRSEALDASLPSALPSSSPPPLPLQVMTNRPICDSAVYTRDTHPRWRFLRPCALCTHPTRTSAIAISSASCSVTGNHRTRELGIVRVPPSDSAVDAPLRDDMLGQRIVDDGMRLRWRNTDLRRFDGAVPMVDANTIVCDARALVLLHDAGALAAGDRHAAHVRADGRAA